MRFKIALALTVLMGFAAGYAPLSWSMTASETALSEEAAAPGWRDPQDAVYRVTESDSVIGRSEEPAVRI